HRVRRPFLRSPLSRPCAHARRANDRAYERGRLSRVLSVRGEGAGRRRLRPACRLWPRQLRLDRPRPRPRTNARPRARRREKAPMSEVTAASSPLPRAPLHRWGMLAILMTLAFLNYMDRHLIFPVLPLIAKE